MFITQTQIPLEVKREEVFSVLNELKNCNLKVKAYHFWLKTKDKLSEIDINKAYNLITDSISEVKQDEYDRKFGMFKKNSELINKMKEEEQNENMNNDIEELI